MQAAVALGVSEEELEKPWVMQSSGKVGFQLPHSSSQRSCQEQEQGGLVSSCWSISRVKWFFKPSSGQLKFHRQALGECCCQVNFQPKLLRCHCAGSTAHPPAGDFQPKKYFKCSSRHKNFVHSFSKRCEHSLPGSGELQTTACPQAPAGPKPPWSPSPQPPLAAPT